MPTFRTAAVRAIHATIDGARWAIWLSALRVLRVLSAALVLARDLDATARRWRWLTAALFDPVTGLSDIICVAPGRNGGRSMRAGPELVHQRTALLHSFRDI